MEEKKPNVGRRLLRTMLERHYRATTIDFAVGLVAFAHDPMRIKKELLSFLEQEPMPTEEEFVQKIREIAPNYEGIIIADGEYES